jgi:hypothetical protein
LQQGTRQLHSRLAEVAATSTMTRGIIATTLIVLIRCVVAFGAGEVFIAKANFVVTLEQVDAALLNVGFEPRQPELITQVKFLGRSPLAG